MTLINDKIKMKKEKTKENQRHYCISLWLAMLCSLFSFLFSLSCIGVSADLQMRADGSGRMVLEYRYSHMAETIGRLDGNERWNIIPTGRADFERTVRRIPGMKLASFSSREIGGDIVNKAALNFENSDALLQFLDPQGGDMYPSRASYIRSGGSDIFNIIIVNPAESVIDSDLLALARQVSDGYSFNLSFSSNKNSTLSVTDGTGRVITPPPGVVIADSGRKVSVSIATGDLLKMKDGFGIQITSSR